MHGVSNRDTHLYPPHLRLFGCCLPDCLVYSNSFEAMSMRGRSVYCLANTASGVTDEYQGCERLPSKLIVKTGPHSACISLFSILLVFSRWLFFCVFGMFSRHIRIHYYFSSFFFSEYWLVGPLRCPVVPLQLSFHTWSNLQLYATAYCWWHITQVAT